MSKTIKGFKSGDEIPSSAKYLSSGIGRTGLMTFYYEIKESATKGTKRDGVDFTQITFNVITYLNERAGKSYSPKSEITRKLIKARILDGMTEDQLKTVVDHKVESWKDDIKMEPYLRPQTLFSTKCEGYFNEVPAGQQEDNLFAELESYNVKAENA